MPMRLRHLLPVLQVLTSVALIAIFFLQIPKVYQVPQGDGNSKLIIDEKTAYCCTNVDTFLWVAGINLPAAWVALPLAIAVHRDFAPSLVRILSFAFGGIFVWFFAGRFFDDVISWRRENTLPPFQVTDFIFALLTFPTVVLVGAAFVFGGRTMILGVTCGMFWFVLSSCALTFRTVQFVRRRALSNAATDVN